MLGGYASHLDACDGGRPPPVTLGYVACNQIAQLFVLVLAKTGSRGDVTAYVYAFTFYVFQQLNRWPKNGEDDYARNIRALAGYLTPACKSFLESDFAFRRDNGELRQRVRGVYEIPGHGYADDPTARVKALSDNDWVVTLDISADEYYGGEMVKRALLRYPIKVARMDVDPEHNPFGLALDCYASPPQRIVPAPKTASTGAHVSAEAPAP